MALRLGETGGGGRGASGKREVGGIWEVGNGGFLPCPSMRIVCWLPAGRGRGGGHILARRRQRTGD